MTDIKSTKEILGYVSAYLKQPPRSLAEVERDYEARQQPDQGAEAPDNANPGDEAARGPGSRA